VCGSYSKTQKATAHANAEEQSLLNYEKYWGCASHSFGHDKQTDLIR
jgi:hypothetical protein